MRQIYESMLQKRGPNRIQTIALIIIILIFSISILLPCDILYCRLYLRMIDIKIFVHEFHSRFHKYSYFIQCNASWKFTNCNIGLVLCFFFRRLVILKLKFLKIVFELDMKVSISIKLY